MKLSRDSARSPKLIGIDLGAFVPILPLMPTLRWWWGHWWVLFVFGLGPIVLCGIVNLVYRRPISWFFWRAFHALRGTFIAASPWWVRRAFFVRIR